MKIWTDGGCVRNGQPDAIWAWAFLTEAGIEESGRLENTTNNRAELTAIIRAVQWARHWGHFGVTIISDSMLCVNCCSGRWKKKANLDLWQEFAEASKNLNAQFRWVRGHSYCAENNRCDELCTLAMAEVPDSAEVQHLKAILSENA